MLSLINTRASSCKVLDIRSVRDTELF